MRPNSIIACVLYATALVGLTIWLGVERQGRLRLTEEHQVLAQQLDQMAGIVAENERLSNLVAHANRSQPLPDDQSRELLRLRGEAGVLRRQARELEAVRNENRQARAALDSSLKTQNAGAGGAAATTNYWPRESWTFAGYASPDAALKTLFWASNNGDLRALLGSTTGDLQKQVEKDLADKSGSEASAKAMTEFARLKSVSVLSREVQADDTVVLTTAVADETGTHTGKVVMKKIGNEWKFSGPPE